MNINSNGLETARTLALEDLNEQALPPFLKKRWTRALEKAVTRLGEYPYISWQGNRVLLVSPPNKNLGETMCKFYEATQAECRRIDKDGLCQAFFDGFPCWHRAAFCLLQIYFGAEAEFQFAKIQRTSPQKIVN